MDFYLQRYQIVYKTMMTGSYFGDYEVIYKILRQHTTRSKGDCNMLTLHKQALHRNYRL